MRVYEIIKKYRNNSAVLHIIVYNDEYGNEDIEELVIDACNKQDGGLNYGYECEWEQVTNPLIIESVILDEVRNLVGQQESITNKVKILQQEIKTLFK